MQADSYSKLHKQQLKYRELCFQLSSCVGLHVTVTVTCGNHRNIHAFIPFQTWNNPSLRKLLKQNITCLRAELFAVLQTLLGASRESCSTNQPHTVSMQSSWHFLTSVKLHRAFAYLALYLVGLLGRASPSAKKTPEQTSTSPSSQGGDQDKLLSTFADSGRQCSVKQLVVGTLAA